MDIFNILGIRVDNLSKTDILSKISVFLSEQKFHQIATVNPEFILEAQKNPEFKNILNGCDLNVADGFGIKMAFLKYGGKLKTRMAGADLMLEILKIADARGLNIFLAAKREGLSTWEETRDAILQIYPHPIVSGTNIKCHSECSEESKKRSFAYVQDDKCDIDEFDIVFANLGAPHQELFINSIKSDTIRLAMGVGGSFDFLTKKQKRAPVFMLRLGLEWLWRLIQNPKRWKRILNATVIFPWKIFRN